MYTIGSFEVNLARTKKASKAILHMLDCANAGNTLNKEDVSFLLSNKQWNSIPWNQIPVIIYEQLE